MKLPDERLCLLPQVRFGIREYRIAILHQSEQGFVMLYGHSKERGEGGKVLPLPAGDVLTEILKLSMAARYYR